MADSDSPQRTINFCLNEGASDGSSPRCRVDEKSARSSSAWNSDAPELSSFNSPIEKQSYARNPLVAARFHVSSVFGRSSDEMYSPRRLDPVGSGVWRLPSSMAPSAASQSVPASNSLTGPLRNFVRERLNERKSRDVIADEGSRGRALRAAKSSIGLSAKELAQFDDRPSSVHNALSLESSKMFHAMALLLSLLSLLHPSTVFLTGFVAVELLHLVCIYGALPKMGVASLLSVVLECAGAPRFMWLRASRISVLCANFSRLRGLPGFLNQDEGNGCAENLSIQLELIIGNALCLLLCASPPPQDLTQRIITITALIVMPFLLTNFIGSILIHPLEKTLYRCLTSMDPVPIEVAQVVRIGGYTLMGRIIERYAALSEASIEPFVQFAPSRSLAFIQSMGTKLSNIRSSLDSNAASVHPTVETQSRTLKETQKTRRHEMLMRNVGIRRSQLETFDFTCLDQDKGVAVSVCKLVLESSSDGESSIIENFIFKIRSLYQDNPYHNWKHGVDVMHSTARFLDMWFRNQLFESHERFALYVSSLAHDVGHPGFNNQFLILSSDALALRYNDSSVLENFHCALLFKTLQNGSENVLGHMTIDTYRECRRIIIQTILGTDLANHFKQVKALRVLIEMNTTAFYYGQEEFRTSTPENYRIHDEVLHVLAENKDMCLEMALHLADVGTLLKPFDVCKKWANLIIEEFFAQGDKERELGLPVQMSFDRDRANFYESQIGFAEVIVAPLLTLSAYAFPPMTSALPRAETNVYKWYELWILDGEKSPEEVTAMGDRITAIMDDFADACQFQRKPSQGGTDGERVGRHRDSPSRSPASDAGHGSSLGARIRSRAFATKTQSAADPT